MKPSRSLLATFLVTCLSLASIAPANAAPGDAQYLIARDAFRAGDWTRLERVADKLDDHELAPYVDYFKLRMHLEQSNPAALQAFLTRHEGSYIAEKMRGDWLRLLAKKERWDEFEANYPKLQQAEQEVTCLALQGRLKKKDPAALIEAMALWLNLLEPPESCQPVLEALIWEKKVLANEVWARIRRQFEANRLQWAKVTMAYLPPSQTPETRQIELLSDKPAFYLAKQPATWANSRLGRELAALAVQRLANSDPSAAAEQLEKIQGKLQDSEKLWAWSQIGLQAARRHQPEALGWFARAGAAQLSDEAGQWKVRAALRALDWGAVRSTIEAMSPALAAKPEWIYWLGRSYKAGGRLSEANALFTRISGQANFYGNLADEDLGKRLHPPPKASAPTREEQEKAETNPALRRALAFFRLDLRSEGVREWSWALRGMKDRELLAAADFAKRKQIFDRAINTADKTQFEHDYSLRYLAPFSDQVRPAAKNRSLDDAWVYGLMRQESRFIVEAKSTVGAAGLMQLMPATARWVAKKIGLKDFQPHKVHDTETNVTLGTSYMRMVLDSLGNHPVLASAAYNAGPGRARKWQDVRPMEGAIYAETIPFTETRDYVKKVMSNAVYYSAQFNGQPDSLKARLGTIAARGMPPTGEDLP